MERVLREIYRGDNVVHHVGADLICLQPHLLHEPRSLNGFSKPWAIFNIRRIGKLAACLQAGYKEQLQIGTSSVDAGGIADRSGPDDQDPGVVRVKDVTSFCVTVRGVGRDAASGELVLPKAAPCAL